MAEEIPKLNTDYHTHNGLDSPELETDLVDDETPQLGGDLDLNGNQITSPDGTDLIDIPNGSIDLQTASTSRVDITDSGVRLGAANARVTTVLDEDAMGTDSATALATQQSIKAYVDSNAPKFGGDGSDGALGVSGTTNLDAASANVLLKNYTSISITGTLGLSNRATDGSILILKSQGDVTISGTIDLYGDGAIAETNGYDIIDATDHFSTTISGGTQITENLWYYTSLEAFDLYHRFIGVHCGSGGADGADGHRDAGGDAVGGIGGRGGGAVIIECAGALDFDGEIICAGSNGTAGEDNTTGAGAGGGGGGGAGISSGGGGAAGGGTSSTDTNHTLVIENKYFT